MLLYRGPLGEDLDVCVVELLLGAPHGNQMALSAPAVLGFEVARCTMRSRFDCFYCSLLSQGERGLQKQRRAGQHRMLRWCRRCAR